MKEILAKSYKFNNGLISRLSGETLMVYNEKSSEIYELNAVSADIYSYLERDNPLSEILDWLSQVYDVSKEEIENDVISILKRFVSCKIIFIN